MTNSDFQKIAEEVQVFLAENPEWRSRYQEYGEKISANIDYIKTVRRSFHEWSPLNVYMNISSAKNAVNSIRFELRYLGQTVADLKANTKAGHKLSTKRYEKINCRDFGCDICLSDADWKGDDVAKFRTFFKQRKGDHNAESGKNGREHELESQLLTEFSTTIDKVIRQIKPVKIGGVRFPMPTPISASDHKTLKYSGPHGGGIDLFTRIGTGGPATRLCIIELKDENEPDEPPRDALKQAVAYATFIRELLRSDAGLIWWKIFGFGGKIPETLELYAACAMPSNENNDYSFKDMEVNIGNDTIKLHYLYFTEEGDRIIIEPKINTSLPIEPRKP